ncbi:MAG: hypothetical protein CMK59_10730 [Proteobacteria bacterium]|nr:hypothetical protein [Pseudomonadota bacterium]
MIIFYLVAVAWADWHSYDKILNNHVHDGLVDYQSLRSSQALSAELIWLSKAPIPKGNDAQKAFWINTYNLITLKLVVDNPNIQSLKELDNGNVWKTRTFKVANNILTLNDIENEILRPMGDPRIHAAITCASKSCPLLSNKMYSEQNLDQQLNTASKHWISTNALLVSVDNIQLNPIFSWFSEDFTSYSVYCPKISKKKQGALGFVLHFSSPEQQEELLLLLNEKPDINFFEYDWTLNNQE